MPGSVSIKLVPATMTETSGQPTPEELKAEARRLRRQRQTTKNLVASLVASLGIVAFLVVVVARPDTPVRAEIDYLAIGDEVSAEAPGELALPALDETWSANRADLSEETGVPTWTVGLISTTGDFVQLIQLFGPESSVDSFIEDGIESSVVLGGTDSPQLQWNTFDRQNTPDVGNYSFIAYTPTAEGTLLLRGNSEQAVVFLATMIQRQQPQLFEPGEN